VLLVCTVYSVLYSEIALSRKQFGIGHMHIYTFFLLRMTDTMTSLNTDLSSWDMLYILTTFSCAMGSEEFRSKSVFMLYTENETESYTSKV
jgi:hypothetical protein